MIDLKTFRKINKLTQQDVADYLGGIGKAFISQIEHGTCRLPTKHLEALLNNDRGWDTSLLLETGTIIQKIGDNSEHNTQIVGDAELAVCQQKVEYLERLLEEKERMIQVLLEKK